MPAGDVVDALVVALAESRVKNVWHDEIYTATIVRAGGVGEIWKALASGVDLNPPLNYLGVYCADTVLGPSLISLRLPSSNISRCR